MAFPVGSYIPTQWPGDMNHRPIMFSGDVNGAVRYSGLSTLYRSAQKNYSAGCQNLQSNCTLNAQNQYVDAQGNIMGYRDQSGQTWLRSPRLENSNDSYFYTVKGNTVGLRAFSPEGGMREMSMTPLPKPGNPLMVNESQQQPDKAPTSRSYTLDNQGQFYNYAQN